MSQRIRTNMIYYVKVLIVVCLINVLVSLSFYIAVVYKIESMKKQISEENINQINSAIDSNNYKWIELPKE